MSSSVKYDKYSNDAENNSPTPGSLGHKNSLRGTKLARRARSFKDDFLEKISQIRTPTNTLGRSHSPSSPRSKTAKVSIDDVKPIQDLNYHVRQVKHALTHFKDVIFKKKLEMLPGNGTVVLESVANVHTALQSYMLNENSTTLISATTQVYMSLGKLIQLCDEVLLSENEEKCASLCTENVTEVVDLVENSIKNLVDLVNEKITKRDGHLSYSNNANNSSCNTLQRPSIDVAGQRTSLPDIPLTPRERDLLEKTSTKKIRTSHSTESILRDSSPPPKPPLPNRNSNPPPLPPKRKSQKKIHQNCTEFGNDNNNQLLSCGLDRMSLRSKSPDDNSSLLSVSSLDSALNHSREEEELRALTIDQYFDEHQHPKDDIQQYFSHRFDSLHSQRTSVQSVSTKRSSEQSVESTKSSHLSSEFAMHKTDMAAFGSSSSSSTLSGIIEKTTSISQQQIQQHQQHTTKIYSCSFNNITENMINVSQNNFTKSNSIHTNSHHQIGIENSSHQQHQQHHYQQQQYQTIQHSAGGVQIDTNVFEDSGPQQQQQYNEEAEEEEPPELPVKTRNRSTRTERHPSQYDNVEETDNFSSTADMMSFKNNFQESRQYSFGLQAKHQSLIEPRNINHFADGIEQPPPLPVKKKHIMAYMEMFGNCSHTAHNSTEFLRHSVHTYNLSHTSAEHITTTSSSHTTKNLTHSQTMSLSPLHKQIINESTILSPTNQQNDECPPALPPKKQRINKTPSISTPPSSPKRLNNDNNKSICTQCSTDLLMAPTTTSSSSSPSPSSTTIITTISTTPTTNNDMKRPTIGPLPIINSLTIEDVSNINTNRDSGESSGDGYIHLYDTCETPNTPRTPRTPHTPRTPRTPIITAVNDDDAGEVVFRNNSANKQNDDGLLSNADIISNKNIIEELDVAQYLVMKKDKEDGPDVKGGYIDALIVHASRVQKVTENAFGEAFITTFRTFITPVELMEKLIRRYTIFSCQINDQKQKSAKESFSLLVRVVNDLTAPDLTSHQLSLLNDFVYQLVCSGQLMMAKLLRIKILEKIMLYKQQKLIPINPILPSRAIITSPPTLLDLKSADIAEQMTLLDAELFQKIEIPEVLIWAQEQCEERSPNLTKFTEHFNKMSYWARSQILKQEDAKDREKHVIKFIKIMKHLRKINNYNSYLALLSALDSAPIRRLEWHKTITEGLKEYCALIDSSSSFRAYRQALAETNPPCIPYIGLVLQDLTFVHIGNQNYLNGSIINFSKRWQQHNIVVNMKRFRKCSSYSYKKNERIIGFFDNFENYLDEDAMWQISENIKPRGTRKPISN